MELIIMITGSVCIAGLFYVALVYRSLSITLSAERDKLRYFNTQDKKAHGDLEEMHGKLFHENGRLKKSLEGAEIKNIHLNAELARERNVHTDYWQDSAGRWRHPDKPCKCVKASVVMEAQLRKEYERELKRKEADSAYKGGQAQASKDYKGSVA